MAAPEYLAAGTRGLARASQSRAVLGLSRAPQGSAGLSKAQQGLAGPSRTDQGSAGLSRA
eukprot:3942858-Pyramimonas_sp.AAC.1